MNKQRKQRFNDAIDYINDAISELYDIQAEEQDALDSLPDSLRNSSRGDEMGEWVDFIDNTVCSLENVINDIECQVN